MPARAGSAFFCRGIRKARRPVVEHGLQVSSDFLGIQVERALDLVHLTLHFHGYVQGIHEAVEHVEETANQRQLDDFGLVEVPAKLLINVIPVSRCIAGHVLGPQYRGFLACVKVRRFKVVVAPDGEDLLLGDSSRLTKRRVMGNSVSTAIDVAGLDNHHFL